MRLFNGWFLRLLGLELVAFAIGTAIGLGGVALIVTIGAAIVRGVGRFV